MHPGEIFFTAAGPSVSRRDFLPIPTKAGRSSAILATLETPAIFAIPAILAIRSFERHIVNGKKIHADRRQGDRPEDFERASDRGPREFSRSSEEPCAVDA